MRGYVEATFGWDELDQTKRFEAGINVSGIQIIEADGKTAGMWETNRETDPWLLQRIAIVPREQSKGIGSYLISKFLADADGVQRQVALQVLKVNPARSLYARFGFVIYEETATHFKMLRDPQLPQTKQGGAVDHQRSERRNDCASIAPSDDGQ